MKNNTLLGIALMVITTFLFSVMDGISRILADDNSVMSLVSFRYWFVSLLIVILCLFINNGFKRIIYTKQPFLQLSRGIILSINNCIVIYSFTLIGLMETHVFIACYPLIVAFLSVPFWEKKLAGEDGVQ